MRELLAKIVAVVTGVDRYFPEKIEGDHGVVSMVFRAFEQAFGRRRGVRVESLSGATEDEFGNKSVVREFFTLEAILTYAEFEIRRWWRDGVIQFPSVVSSPRLAELLGFAVATGKLAGFVPIMAIAYDTSTSGNNNTSGNTTWSHTNGGSVTMLVVCGMGRNTISNINYAGAGTTFLNGISGSSNYNLCQYKGTPATGANNVDISWTTGTFQKAGIAISFSGSVTTMSIVNNNAGNSTSPSQTLNGIKLTSLVVNFVQHNQGTLPSGVTGTGVTQRLAINPANTCAVSTTVPPSSSVTSGWTFGAANVWVTISAEVKDGVTVQTKTVTAKARMKVVGNDKTVTAKARMKVLGNDKTVTAKALMKVVGNDKTVTAKAMVSTAVTKTVTAKADIFNTVSQTITAKADILKTILQEVSAMARIKVGQSSTVQAKARIAGFVSSTVTAKARIDNAATYSLEAKARIKVVQSKFITAMARLINTVSQTIQARAAIKQQETGVLRGIFRRSGSQYGIRVYTGKGKSSRSNINIGTRQ